MADPLTLIRGSVAGDDLDSSLIVPLIKRAEPEAAGGSSPLSWPEGDTPIAEELVGELHVSWPSGLSCLAN